MCLACVNSDDYTDDNDDFEDNVDNIYSYNSKD